MLATSGALGAAAVVMLSALPATAEPSSDQVGIPITIPDLGIPDLLESLAPSTSPPPDTTVDPVPPSSTDAVTPSEPDTVPPPTTPVTDAAPPATTPATETTAADEPDDVWAPAASDTLPPGIDVSPETEPPAAETSAASESPPAGPDTADPVVFAAAAEDSNGFSSTILVIKDSLLYDETITFGEDVELVANVRDRSDTCVRPILPDCDVPTGSMELFQNGVSVGSGPVVAASDKDAQAVFEFIDLPVGTYQFVAHYRPGNFDPSSSNPVTIRVVKADCAITLTQDPSSSTAGEEVDFIADMGSSGHSGRVAFYDGNGEIIGDAALFLGAVAVLSTTTLPVGANTIHAVYPGDGNFNACESGTVTHVVAVPPGPPVAVDDNIGVHNRSTFRLYPLGNDSDPNSDPLAVVGVSDPAHGTAIVDVGGEFVEYTADTGFSGADSFEYTVSDPGGLTDVGLFSIAVSCLFTPVDDGPYEVPHNRSLSVGAPGVLGNDDPQCDAATVTWAQPEHGSVSGFSDGAFDYTPEEDYTGPDSFTYTLTDSATGLGDSATVSLNVGECAASVEDDLYIFESGETIEDPAPGVAWNDTLCGLDVVIVDQPDHGTATLAPDGALTYAPEPGFVGTDSFSYTAQDSSQAAGWRSSPRVIAPTRPATVTFSVEAGPVTPTTGPQSTTPSPTAPPTTDPAAPPAPSAPPVTPVPPVTPSALTGTLPATGSSTAPAIALAAFAAVAIGAGLVRFSRRGV